MTIRNHYGMSAEGFTKPGTVGLLREEELSLSDGYVSFRCSERVKSREKKGRGAFPLSGGK